MCRAMIPMLLLAAVALSTGEELPPPQTFEAHPEPGNLEAQYSRSTRNSFTECEILKRVYCKNADWMETWKLLGEPTDDNPEGINYNEHFNTDYDSLKDEQIGVLRPFDRLQLALKNRYFLTNALKANAGKYGYFKKYPPLRNVYTAYLRNQDMPIAGNEAVYATDVDPYYYLKYRLALQYKNVAYQHLYHDSPPTEVDLDKAEEQKKWENSPIVDDVIEKRDGNSESGQKEIPDNLVFNEEQKTADQKKLFSFWSRLQSMSQKGRKPPTRRYAFVYYGPDGVRDGPLTAEIRASHLRPPGQPLRWG